ncbi:histidinol-phosphate phosphatase family protein [Conexibacter arvalis]|uniref:D,D-heptose 1,7-bisphosphate phosphatase n=1 Tax=Conexibacter arvalis TaxID=912552 RepID=A0A840IBT0_9ACTN|nr:HAD-IIIA family hydrolase [Conexibacter arvalis]MBB4662286.1 histidinol-phosphate phosphatase family protein [Conexibacter arvalis]
MRDAGSLSVTVLTSGGRGPAAARNVGWRVAAAEWVVFLDDDVVPGERWGERLLDDLRGAGAEVGGVQGRIRVPLPADRRPTDWERNVAGLASARWATADLAYRRAALAAVGGFDDRFRRNYREDADLGLRVVGAGWRIERGERETLHPVGPTGFWASVRRQAGNADDALMRRLHGRDWRTRAAAPAGRLPRHAATAAAGLTTAGLLLALTAPRRNGSRRVRAAALIAGAGWVGGTAELAWARIAPGPRTPAEVAVMAATSIALPFAAVAHRLAGEWRWRAAAPYDRDAWHGGGHRLFARALHVQTANAPPAAAMRGGGPALDPRGRAPDGGGRPAAAMRGGGPALDPRGRAPDGGGRPAAAMRGGGPALDPRGRAPGGGGRPAAVLFDRDGTLVEDVPYNGDPLRVRPMPGALDALAALRAAGVPTAVVSNQSGIARGLLTPAQVEAVNARVEELLGDVGPWLVCPHVPADGCDCRKPAPGLVLAAAAALGVAPERCVVIGDIGADVAAARAAGARGVLVPTRATLPAEVDAAVEVAPDLLSAVRLVLDGEAVT